MLRKVRGVCIGRVYVPSPATVFAFSSYTALITTQHHSITTRPIQYHTSTMVDRAPAPVPMLTMARKANSDPGRAKSAIDKLASEAPSIAGEDSILTTSRLASGVENQRRETTCSNGQYDLSMATSAGVKGLGAGGRCSRSRESRVWRPGLHGRSLEGLG